MKIVFETIVDTMRKAIVDAGMRQRRISEIHLEWYEIQEFVETMRHTHWGAFPDIPEAPVGTEIGTFMGVPLMRA